jgi:hypothetical protein
MTELQLGKYEFYPNDDELKRLVLIDLFFEKTAAILSDKSIEEPLEELDGEKSNNVRTN